MTACSSTKTNRARYKAVSVNYLFGEDKILIEERYNIILEDEFEYLFDEKRDSGSRYENYIFVFQNNNLVHNIDSSEARAIWLSHSKIISTPPFTQDIAQIHDKLFNLPVYNPEPVSVNRYPGQTSASTPGLGDKLAAGTMLILALPLVPFIYGEKYRQDRARDLDWIHELLGASIAAAENLLGKSKQKKALGEHNAVIGFENPRSQWGLM